MTIIIVPFVKKKKDFMFLKLIYTHKRQHCVLVFLGDLIILNSGFECDNKKTFIYLSIHN